MFLNGYEIKPGAYLRDANLRGANLRNANLLGANLLGSDLRGADLRGAYLPNVNLSGANLRNANLGNANLGYASLMCADLRGANLRDANLQNVNLQGANLPRFQITPKGYQMHGFKKLANGTVAVLKISAEAKRTASLVDRKCRAEYVEVISGEGYDTHTGTVYYKPGDTIYPDKYDGDIRVECTHGIHFFQTYEEAEEY